MLLTMAQNFAPAVASTSEGIPLLGELLDSLDTFNRTSKDWQVDDADDLSWSTEGQLHFISFNEFKEGLPSAMKLISRGPLLSYFQ